MASPCCLTTLFLLLLLVLAACSTGRIPLGSEISASEGQVWASDNGTFAFGFSSTGSDDRFLLSIWYAELPGDRTIVWSPNSGATHRELPVGRDSVARLDNAGNLALLERNALIWSSNTSNQGVEFGVMSDSGSFMLCNSSESTGPQVAWQSFWHPSDTLLPGQPLSVSLELTSPRSPLGYYSLKMLQQSTSLSLALTYVSPELLSSSPESKANYSYWSSPMISNASGSVVALLDQSGNFSIVYGKSSSGTMYVHKNDTGGNHSMLRRITVGTDGNLRLYRWDSHWVTEWSAVSNPCTVAGICGSGVCNLDASKTNASCTCLPGMSPVDQNGSGCLSSSQQPFSETCNANRSTGARMETMPQTNYYFMGASTIVNYSNISSGSTCAEYCHLDCKCVASVYGLSEENTYCSTLKSMVFGGLQDPSSTLYVKVGDNSSGTEGSGSGRGRPNNAPSQGPSGSSKRDQVVLPLLLCISSLVVLLSLLLCYSIRRRRLRQQGMLSGPLSVPGTPMYLSYHDLQTATSNFSRLLGTGGFGSVYMGILRDGTPVAVKKLERVLPHGEREFVTEVTTIGSMHHMNLVSLCGFCSEGSHRLLVYEYMSNGSLDKWIFPSNSEGERLLEWRTRFHIATAVAQGIAYFHEQCRNRIIHCDIKPENILLDENFCPKVSDFGLAKLMSREHSHVVTMVRGTRGYLAPEWVGNRPITVKADVYSYGMLLLEITGGRRNLDMSLDAEDFYYPGWAFKEMMNGTPLRVADRRLGGNVEEVELLRALNVAFWCIQEEAWMRPSMGEVVKMLEGSVEINRPPMPQAVLELVAEGLHSVYKAMRRDCCFNRPIASSSVITSQKSSQATCSYSTMSPR